MSAHPVDKFNATVRAAVLAAIQEGVALATLTEALALHRQNVEAAAPFIDAADKSRRHYDPT